jgi:hypothetical protein
MSSSSLASAAWPGERCTAAVGAGRALASQLWADTPTVAARASESTIATGALPCPGQKEDSLMAQAGRVIVATNLPSVSGPPKPIHTAQAGAAVPALRGW